MFSAVPVSCYTVVHGISNRTHKKIVLRIQIDNLETRTLHANTYVAVPKCNKIYSMSFS